MGNKLSSNLGCFEPVKEPTRHILIVGPCNAGKTTVLTKIGKPIGGSRISTSQPGVQLETARVKGLEFVILDRFDNDEKRRQYRSFFRTTRGIIVVVDMSVRSSYTEAANTIKNVFDDDDLFGIPLLVLCNKADVADSIGETEIISGLRLNHLHGLDYSVHLIAATNTEFDTAFFEGLNWLAEQVEVNDELNRAREPFSI